LSTSRQKIDFLPSLFAHLPHPLPGYLNLILVSRRIGNNRIMNILWLVLRLVFSEFLKKVLRRASRVLQMPSELLRGIAL
jgi:hypothetical protein